MDRAQQLSACLARAAARPQIARLIVRLAGTVAVDAVGWRLGPGRSSLLPIAAELLAAGASVAVVGMIVDEVAAGEAAVGAVLVEHREMRLDAFVVPQTGEVLGRAVARVGGEALGPDAAPTLPHGRAPGRGRGGQYA